MSEVGSRITRDGVPLLAVMVLGATPFQMAQLTAINGAVVLALSLHAGLWVDRIRRRPLLIRADIGRALVIGSIPASAALGVLGMSQLYLVMGLAAALTVLFDVGYQTYVPSLVKRAELVEANSKLTLSGSVAEILGPGLTGVLVQALTAPVAILLDALSFLWSALMIALIRKPEPAPAPSEESHWRAEIAGGFRAMFGHPVLAALATRAGIAWFFVGFFGPLYVLYCIRDLRFGPVALGLTIAVGGVGNLLGALWAPAIARRFPLGATFLGAALVWSFSVFLVPIAGGPLWLALTIMMAGQLLGDFAYVVYSVHETSLRQAVTPPALLGRVNSVMQLLTRGMWPLGALTGGAIAERYDARTAFWIAATGIFLSIFWLARAPVRTLAAHPEAGDYRGPGSG